MTEIAWSLHHPTLALGLVEARGLSAAPSGESLRAWAQEIVARRGAEPVSDAVREGVRAMLRVGGHKPSGRGKPASEYLAAAAQRGELPWINAAVDINNAMSLDTGLPMSGLDLDRCLDGADALEVRLGVEGERYVFNTAGQEIDLKGLVCVARRGGAALGNPVKDAMLAKTHPETRALLAVIYADAQTTPAPLLLQIAQRYADALVQYAGALHVRAWTLTQP